MNNDVILVTGGAGYIGSHMVLVLLQAGREVVVLDNLCNSNLEGLRRVELIAARTVTFVQGDVRDAECLKRVFSDYNVSEVIHFAGLKAVGESVSEPLKYYDYNVVGAQRLFEAMADAEVFSLVFSSSATVYGDPASVPIDETFPLSATNPYGRSKLHIEGMLGDLAVSDARWKIAILRYFNPVGAHYSGQIGEDPSGIPNNLMPYIAQVASGKRAELSVFGGDYDTIDGTGVRDYIHVMDLVEGHLAALNKLSDPNVGLMIVNLGTGHGYSVLQMIEAFVRASGKEIPYSIVARRNGDVAQCYANPAYAISTLGWKATRGLKDMCADHWRWQMQNPLGYAG